MKLRIPVNLASEPFTSTRRVVAGAVTAAVLLSASLVLLVSLSLVESGQADEMRRTISRLEAQSQSLASERARLEQVLRRPENAVVLERNLFLNELLYAKGISWTRLFDDLEQVLPYNVRLVSIRPQITGQNNQVLLDMVVGAQSEQPVIDFLVRLEQSPRFGRTTPHNRMPPTQSEPLLRWRFSVNYHQDLDAAQVQDTAQAGAVGGADSLARGGVSTPPNALTRAIEPHDSAPYPTPSRDREGAVGALSTSAAPLAARPTVRGTPSQPKGGSL